LGSMVTAFRKVIRLRYPLGDPASGTRGRRRL